MQTATRRRERVTTISPAAREVFALLIRSLGPHVRLPPLGKWKSMTNNEVWSKLVSQICVRGSARGMDAINRNEQNRTAFVEATSLEVWAKEDCNVDYFAGVLEQHGATRFHNVAAATLLEIVSCETAIRKKRVVLLEQLHSVPSDFKSVRAHLMDRCPVFGLKSASDFMIETGISDDVIALDTRIVNLLKEHFNYNLNVNRSSVSEPIYLSLEDALRKVCAEERVPLAMLDRMLFGFSATSVIDFVMKLKDADWFNREKETSALPA